MIFDPIADLLTRTRNALTAKHLSVSVPHSNIKESITKILVEEGYVSSYEIKEEGTKKDILITLKYGPKGEKVIRGIKRISKPGLRIFVGVEKLPRVLNGMGIAIISTSKGIVTDKKARELNMGGEVLAYVW